MFPQEDRRDACQTSEQSADHKAANIDPRVGATQWQTKMLVRSSHRKIKIVITSAIVNRSPRNFSGVPTAWLWGRMPNIKAIHQCTGEITSMLKQSKLSERAVLS